MGEISDKNGIYKIINTINGKIYIGSTFSKGGLNRRWIVHKCALKNKRHSNKHLQYAWNKYGPDAFIFEIIEIVSDHEIILNREQYYIDLLQPFNDEIGYNICRSAAHPFLGCNHTEESKRKIGKASEGNQYALGVKASDETRKKMSDSRRNISQETRNKMSIALIGNKRGVGNKNVFKRAVDQLDLNNNFIKSWVSITEPTNELKTTTGNICRAIKNNKTCRGFRWRYSN